MKWKKGIGLFCGDSTSPTCTVQLTGNEVLDEAILALFEVDYIMPIFKDVGFDPDGDGLRNELDEDDDNDGLLDVDDQCPLLGPNLDYFGCPRILPSSTIIANGKEWAQPLWFTQLSWNDINAVCPEGVCIDGGMLNGRDMTGWIWASLDDVGALFNFYDPSLVVTSQYANLMFYKGWVLFDSGWAPIFSRPDTGKSLGGVTRTLTVNDPGSAICATWFNSSNGDLLIDFVYIDGCPIDKRYLNYEEDYRSAIGAWFYRAP